MGQPFHFMKLLIYLFILLTITQMVSCGHNTSFDWLPSSWSRCVYRDRQSCCECSRVRDISCIHMSTGKLVAPFYCHKSGINVPLKSESCTVCQQDCVLSTWSDWSQCSDTCTPGLRYRKRDLILPDQNSGNSCGPLMELEECQDPDLPLCIFADLSPQYAWQVGNWSSCRQTTDKNGCGEGVRDRAVTCVNKVGDTVADNYCVYYLHGAQPTNAEHCAVPCDCDVTSWTDWGPCSKTCYKGAPNVGYHGYQVRTRSVVHHAEKGGVSCPALKDTRSCDALMIPKCPSYVWHQSSWGECTLPHPHQTTALCGPGVQTRDIYCTLDGDVTLEPVADILCSQDAQSWRDHNDSSLLKPPERRACHVTCPVDCTVGEWENWSACTQSCGTGGVQIRTKPVIQPMTEGGQSCDTSTRYDEKSCDPTPCSWWHSGQWSVCTTTSVAPGSCGLASQVRSVYCVNSMDEIIADDECLVYGTKPDTEQDCWVPCPGDCEASDWSEWGECSVSCGVQGGVQTKTRIITVNTKPSEACKLENDLIEIRPCNQIPCKTYLWQVSPWSVCQRDPLYTVEECGEGKGLQTRELTCQKDPGYPVNSSWCDLQIKPLTGQVCIAPCPQNCKLSGWSDWSICSQKCGEDSVKVKFRAVLQWNLHGGSQCPGNPDKNGIIIKKKRCTRKMTLQCGNAKWKTSKWTECQIRSDELSCGKGAHSRNVTCVLQGKEEVNYGVCFEQGVGAPPNSEETCHVPCSGDCRLSQWSAYAPCSQTCGNGLGVQTRSRYVINWDPSLPLTVQCQHLDNTSLTEAIACRTPPCPSYQWHTSSRGSCIPHNDEESLRPSCGEGVQTRHVLCAQNDGAYVPEHMCDIVGAMPRRQQSCHVICRTDCQVSDWSDWGNCSQICGNGLQHRQRTVIQSTTVGGMSCPHLEEITTCFIRDCMDLDWQVYDWSDCDPNWGMHCGKGIQRRTVTCSAGVQSEADCTNRKPKPDVQMECYVPCIGDCVLSEWSNYTPCDCETPDATKTRFREIIQDPVPSAMQCGPITDTVSCDCPTYRLVIGGWTNCQLVDSASNNQPCGKGIERRPINCVHSDGMTVHLSNCFLGNLTLSQTCDIPCPKNCEVAEYSSWTTCSKSCGVEAKKMRRATVIDTGNYLGAKCPPVDQLEQIQICNSIPCYNYTWYRGEWHGCHSNTPGHCGVSMETRVVDCRRSDGVVAQDIYCKFQDQFAPSASRTNLILSQKEAIHLDLHTERSCGEPCPGDCVVTEWSDYGPCIRNCSDLEGTGVQSRSRAIVRPSLGGSPCPWETMQTRSCLSEDAVCPLFTWQTGDWNSRDKRKVHCVLDGLVVHGGCVSDDQPSRYKECDWPCGDFAECLEGICVCELGFSGDGVLCLPDFGCATDDHCILNTTYCDLINKQCLCWDATLPGPDLSCAIHVGAVYEPDSLEELNRLFIYILIGCLIALLLLGIVTIVCMISSVWRRRKRSEDTVETNRLTKIDNLDTMPKNNSKKGPEQVLMLRSKEPSNIDKNKNQAQLWQNENPNINYYPYHANLVRPENGVNDSSTSRNTSPHSVSPPPDTMSHNMETDPDEEVFLAGLDEEMADRPFLPARRSHSPRRHGMYCETPSHEDSPVRTPVPYNSSSLPSPKRPLLKHDVMVRLPSTHSVQPNSDTSSGSHLSTFRPESEERNFPSADSDLAAMWNPQNNLSKSPKVNRFPVPLGSDPNVGKSESGSDNNTLPDRKLTSTPPFMYENLSSLESTPEPEPRTPSLSPSNRGPPPPVPPKPLVKHPLSGPRPVINKRNNTEPVPMQYRAAPERFPQGDIVAPAESTLQPQHGLKDSLGLPAPKEPKGRSMGDLGMANMDTEDLLQYCDELLADLQRVANS